MDNELGKLEKPEAAPFRAVRKLYLVPLVYGPEEAPADYLELCQRYWEGVQSSLASLETGAGKVKRIYHEACFVAGEEGLRLVEKMNPGSYQVVKSRCDEGARLEALEDPEKFGEFMDWQRCLVIGLVTQKAAAKVGEFYMEAVKCRFEHIARRIEETLGPEEAGLFIISEGHQVQFPKDVEVFYIAPPALDEIHRWQRDQGRKVERPSEA
ncbi:MAG: hypothetical protein AB1603_05075 [Chloroflexota bacterium]